MTLAAQGLTRLGSFLQWWSDLWFFKSLFLRESPLFHTWRSLKCWWWTDVIYERLLRCQKYCQIMITTIEVNSDNTLPLLTKGAMRYGYALVNASHIAYCTLHIAFMHIALIQGTFSRLTSLLSLSLEQNPLKALSPALLTPTLQVGNNQQSVIIVLCQSHPHSLWSIYARHGQSTISSCSNNRGCRSPSWRRRKEIWKTQSTFPPSSSETPTIPWESST